MTHYNYENCSFFTPRKATEIIQENKQLIYYINFLKGNNENQETKLRVLFSRLQKNLFLLAHLCNQPKAPKHLSVNELLRPVFSCDYSNENKKVTMQNPNSNRAPNLSMNSPVLASNSSQSAYFDSNNLEYRTNDSKPSDQINSQNCENPNLNNISSNSISKSNFEPIVSMAPDYDIIQNNTALTIGNTSSSSNYIQNQNNEHFICRYCQRKCRNQSGLTQHTMKVHPDAPEVQHLLKQAQSRSTPNPLSIINVNSSIY